MKMNMLEIVNLARRIEKRLPAESVKLLKKAGEVANSQQQRVYLVGGMVRDLLLGRDNQDIDLVVEGNAVNLAEALAENRQAKITRHPRFGTAKVQWDGASIDIASARAENYAKPGALPTVKPGTIGNDLARRDFTINAIAIELNPRHFGEILDPHNGRYDLEHGLVRVLHTKSFIDDATRIWRAIRYEQRLDFQLELATFELLKQSKVWLATISGDRTRHEVELILKEEVPEKTLCRADELGVLTSLHPSLKGDTWLAETFTLAREEALPGVPSAQLYLALMIYRLTATETEQLIEYLRIPKAVTQILHDSATIKGKIEELTPNGLPPSRIYNLLHGYNTTALTANMLAVNDDTAEEHFELYLNVLKNVRTSLKGEDIKELGIKSGPKIKEVLNQLQDAKLDGLVSTRREEVAMVRGMVGK
jgi:tRNA nucleotidyltransferase (CCA-adding enzyme)